jgi:hypothetical protein
VPVVDDGGRVVGIFSESDALRTDTAGQPRTACGGQGPRPAVRGPCALMRCLPLGLQWTEDRRTGGRSDVQVRVRLHRGRPRNGRPARRQGREPRRNDHDGPAGPARIHHHHRGLPRVPGHRTGTAGARGRGGHSPARHGACGRAQARAGRPAAARVRPVRGAVLHARHDGDRPQHRPQRRLRQRARRVVR